MRSDVGEVIEELLAEQGSVASREVAEAAGISRQSSHARLAGLVVRGELEAYGKGRATRYRRVGGSRRFDFRREGLEEDVVWRRVRERLPGLGRLSENVETILHYAVTELVNNAVDHSAGDWVRISVAAENDSVVIDILDDGVGIFDRVAGHFGLGSRTEALQELSKGKITTDPATHTGEGIFFTSKAVDTFEIVSGGLRWIVDNICRDVAVGSDSGESPGTHVRITQSRTTRRRLDEIFAEYTADFEFSRTRTVVKLFELGRRFVSRSEAKRLVRGLERFREVIVDFERVETVGQGFVDEIFRVWAGAHPEVRLIPVRMNPAVEFMVRRGLPSKDSRV